MSESGNDVSPGFSGKLYPEQHHICMIFDDDRQRQKIVAEYLAAGLDQGELVRYVADGATTQEVREWLSVTGVEIPDDDSFKVMNAESFYCPNGRFEPRTMIEGMLPRFELFRKAGYSGVRSCGEMTWALRNIPGSDNLLEYESLLGTVGGAFPHIGMCLYDARLFDGATLFKILQVHPYMIARGQIVQNPYYLRPEELEEKFKTSAKR